jgi:uncharacterized membrane protein YdjX (TVP38/TMEM64 family)
MTRNARPSQQTIPNAAVPATGACAAGDCIADGLPKRRSPLRFVPFAVLLVLLVTAYWRGWLAALNLETLVDLHSRFHHVIEQNPFASLLAYGLAYVAVGALCVPGGALLTAAGGLVFGMAQATVATVIGATIGATLIFLVARTALSDWLAARQAVWFQKLRAGFERDAFHYLLFLRLVPAFPFWFVNIAAAALGLKLRTFVLGTLIGIIPASLAFTSAGAGLGSIIDASKTAYNHCIAAGGGATCKLTIPQSALFTKELALSLLLLGALSLLPIAIKRWRRQHA